MPVLNIEQSFLTENRSVLDFLNQSGQGLYIPLYQRDYSWDSDNIEQLLEDLSRGIQRIASGEINNDNKEIRFLGTIITVVESNRNNIYPVEIQAVPPRIEKLIDGQQRISTIALMATLLTKKLTEIKVKIKPNNPIYEDVNDICNIWIDKKLIPIFSFDLVRGTPRLKPKIIRGAKDYWTRTDDVDSAYRSELSNYLGHFIKAYDEKNNKFPCLTKEKYGKTLLYQNGKKIEAWLNKTVSTAHIDQNDEFACANDIISNFSQEHLWDFERDNLIEIIKEKDFSNPKTNSYILNELVQIISVCHYLLDRCCFTIIQPTDDDWAFDMFQSLNATGTPLTAIETFKPTIVNTVDRESGDKFKGSDSDKSFKKVEDFLSEATTAAQKNKRTNDFLTSFFIAYDGKTISTHFSYQRKILNDVYISLNPFKDKELFIKKMGNYAEFYQNWIKYDGKNNSRFPMLDNSDAELASMLILFLKASNHKMAITMLGSMYYFVIEQCDNALNNFTNAVKSISAYYFLWRSTHSNSGLDSTYRDFFKQNTGSQVTLEAIKKHLQNELIKKSISNKENWISKAKSYLKYNTTSNEIIRLSLLISAHDTISNPEKKGMIMHGREGSQNYLNIEKWTSTSLKTIEHIAPKNNNGTWDSKLYEEHTEAYQTLGNLTLLPTDLNSSAGNKSWKEKLLYYQCVAEEIPENLKNIENTANNIGITLNQKTIKMLQSSQFNKHLSSISSLTTDDIWDCSLVNERTEIMLDIIWERVSKWIFN